MSYASVEAAIAIASAPGSGPRGPPVQPRRRSSPADPALAEYSAGGALGSASCASFAGTTGSMPPHAGAAIGPPADQRRGPRSAERSCALERRQRAKAAASRKRRCVGAAAPARDSYQVTFAGPPGARRSTNRAKVSGSSDHSASSTCLLPESDRRERAASPSGRTAPRS